METPGIVEEPEGLVCPCTCRTCLSISISIILVSVAAAVCFLLFRSDPEDRTARNSTVVDYIMQLKTI